MKKKGLYLSKVFVLFMALEVLFFGRAWAETAKEGESNYKAAMSWTFRTIPMEGMQLEMQFDVYGVVVDAAENSPLYNATFYALGQLHAVNGTYTEAGFLRYTRPDGDKVFATYEAKGRLGGKREIKYTFVGGSGKCEGISGGGDFSGVPGLKSPNEGVGMSITVGKFNWKIP